MPSDNGSPKTNIIVSSIKDVIDSFSSEEGGIGLTVAFQDGNIVIGFHKNYIIYETHNAIAFKCEEQTFRNLIKEVSERRVQ